MVKITYKDENIKRERTNEPSIRQLAKIKCATPERISVFGFPREAAFENLIRTPDKSSRAYCGFQESYGR